MHNKNRSKSVGFWRMSKTGRKPMFADKGVTDGVEKKERKKASKQASKQE